MILGLTGGIGSGKSTAAKMFKAFGFMIVDADKECRAVTKKGSEALKKLAAVFGDDILTKNGVLKRKKLGQIVFADEKQLQKLNSIVQKSALEICLNKINKYNMQGKNVVFDVPLLFEGSWDKYCDKTVAVICDKEIRIHRTMERDNISRKDVESRIAKQMSDAERKKRADFVIKNDKDLEFLSLQVRDIDKKLKQLGLI